MSTSTRTGALFLHPQPGVSGNVLWPGELPPDHLAALPQGLMAIRAKDYFASAFPEGDGITFNSNDRTAYQAGAAFRHFSDAFPFLALEPLDPAEGQARALARMAAARTAVCRYLAPVECLRLEAPFELGATRFHAPVDGVDNTLSSHAWRHLCDVPGADVIEGWAPDRRARGTTELLAHPLVERTLAVPLSSIYEAGRSFDSRSGLLRLLMEDADQALDPIRFDLCHYRRLHYLPAKPGWLGDDAVIYLAPESRSLKAQLLHGKPYVLRTSNNWLGLDLDGASGAGAAFPLADVVDSLDRDDITLAIKSALRAWNRAFYLVDLEASFLHLVYAVDALCAPLALHGDRQRLWITAFASGGDATRFASLLAQFQHHYGIRNDIVHRGRSFAELGLSGEDQCEFMAGLLGSCINTFHIERFATRRVAAEYALDVLNSVAIAPLLDAMASAQFKLPLSIDRMFKQHMAAH